jgi:hypothetical protein
MPLTQSDVDTVVQVIAGRLGQSPAQVRKDYWLDPFTYMINFVTPNQLAASATQTLNFIVQNDSAFAICKTTYIIASTANAFVAELQPFGSGLTTGGVGILVTLTDSGSGRSLSDSPVPIDSQYGTGQLPFIWPIPKILDPASTFAATLQNLDATARHVRLAHNGYKVFGNIESWAAKHK